ncbi:Alpha-acetolactate decarboxylase precursor [Poriferisphaera corsica]|uniref:Alpha-acetolactate decarboxylase n=1 Tax=Poriferisphaera corsica TaxID=2528020 RepID=A0A517YZ82_9BACT|nr:acetolactate decarboxylase [Poriferisphaera corsica]QDU35535.1 Alpha-acetolactate decarboxylase precursor [Poriferisphaera corsica]
MKPYIQIHAALLLIVLLILTACERKSSQTSTATQINTIHSLYTAQYDGIITSAELSSYGNFGLGSFTGLDGELIMLDGILYKADENGKPTIASPSITIPFATVTFFASETDIPINQSQQLVDVNDMLVLDRHMCENKPYAIKIKGRFNYIHYRSWPKQNPPYIGLNSLANIEKRYLAKDIDATLIGFYFPQWFGHVNTISFHYHFISDDHTIAGHVLDTNIHNAIVQVDPIDKLDIIFTQSKTSPSQPTNEYPSAAPNTIVTPRPRDVREGNNNPNHNKPNPQIPNNPSNPNR